MNVVVLKDILTPDQLAAVERTCRRLAAQGIDPLHPEYTDRLKELFKPWAAELETKGVVADYLAYALAYTMAATGRHRG